MGILKLPGESLLPEFNNERTSPVELSPDDLNALKFADSIALDPHKWLYVPLEAGCLLDRNPALLIDAFSYHPVYYTFLRGDCVKSVQCKLSYNY